MLKLLYYFLETGGSHVGYRHGNGVKESFSCNVFTNKVKIKEAMTGNNSAVVM